MRNKLIVIAHLANGMVTISVREITYKYEPQILRWPCSHAHTWILAMHIYLSPSNPTKPLSKNCFLENLPLKSIIVNKRVFLAYPGNLISNDRCQQSIINWCNVYVETNYTCLLFYFIYPISQSFCWIQWMYT